MPTARAVKERLIHIVLFACALASVIVTLGIIFVLMRESFNFFDEVSLGEFFGSTIWDPQRQGRFGIWPLICGTMLVAAGALLIAIPTGVGTALILSEYAPETIRQIFKPVLEVLAGIPTVVYGYFALTFITPNVIRPLADALGLESNIFNAASAAIVVGIMIIPTISSLCDDSFRAVPRTLREGAFALAATRFEVSTRVVFPAAISGVVAAILLALGRAVGETMAVSIAAGANPKITANIFESIQTMTGYVVQITTGDTPAGSIEYYSIFGVGLTLFLSTLVINLLARAVMARYREAYE